MQKILIVVILIGAAQCVGARSMFACYEEPGTQRSTCIDEADVRFNGDTRASPLFQVSPRGVKRTGHFFVTNCARQVSTLRKSSGAELAGGYAGSADGARALAEWTCSAKARNDPSLRPL